ncbi:hypothetical protein Dimus_021798 [Dionaea muscipula]
MAQKFFTVDPLRSAAKQSLKILVVPVRLRRAIKAFFREQEMANIRRKVLRLSESFRGIKDANRLLPTSTSKQLVVDPFKFLEQSKRWKIKSAYGYITMPRGTHQFSLTSFLTKCTVHS